MHDRLVSRVQGYVTRGESTHSRFHNVATSVDRFLAKVPLAIRGCRGPGSNTLAAHALQEAGPSRCRLAAVSKQRLQRGILAVASATAARERERERVNLQCGTVSPQRLLRTEGCTLLAAAPLGLQFRGAGRV